jgi:tRNA nucleotidyltransferase (CCA-adding enzyme)
LIPEYAQTVLKTLEDNGYEAYLVGGCVRDMLLGREPNDYDIATNALPTQVKECFAKTVDTGIKHGTVTVVVGNDTVEVTTYRTEHGYSDGRRPDSVEFNCSLQEDLARRDFTINAMAMDLRGNTIDPFGGEQDLENAIVKCVGNPDERFAEDKLRMLRAIRFSCQLTFDIDILTYKSIEEHSHKICVVSWERIREELFKSLLADPVCTMDCLQGTGLLYYIMPEFEGTGGFKQHNPYHQYFLFDHIMMSMYGLGDTDRLELLVTMMLHDLGKKDTQTFDDNGVAHYYHHAKESVKIADKILDRLRVSNEFKHKVLTLIEAHDMQFNGKRSIRKALSKFGEEGLRDLFEVQLADAFAHTEEHYAKKKEEIAECLVLLDEVIADRDCFKIRDLAIGGDDLIAMGYTQGPEIGRILNELFDMVLEDPSLNEKDILIKVVEERYGRY